MSAPQSKKGGRKWPWIVGGIAVLAVIGTATSAGENEPDSAQSAPTTASTTTGTSAPKPEPDPEPDPTTEAVLTPTPYTGPILIPLPLSMAEERAGMNIDATDIGEHIVDTVDRERAIFDDANWRVVTTCDTTDGDTLKVGAIKADEFAAISAAGQGRTIAENTLTFTLDCP